MPSEPSPKQPSEGSGAGYSYYGGNYAGYSAAGYGYGGGDGGNQVQRTLQDYLLIIRERIWYIVVVFLVVFSSSLVYTLSDTKIYQASAMVQIYRRDPTVMQGTQVMDTDIRSAEDLNTQIKVIESNTIVQRVAQGLTGEDLKAFLAPYDHATSDLSFVGTKLQANRKVVPQRLTLVVQIQFQHPDRFVAAKIANLFAQAYIDYNLKLRSDESTMAVEGQQEQVTAQRKRVDELARNLQALREKKGQVSLDSKKDIVNETLKAINVEVTKANAVLQNAAIRRNQIQENKVAGKSLTDLGFIASQPNISLLMQQLSAQQITLDQLRVRYRENIDGRTGHPKVIEAKQGIAQTRTQLAQAIDTVCQQVESDYQGALQNYTKQEQELDKWKQQSLDLDRQKLEYDEQQRELNTQEAILTAISAQNTQTKMSANVATQNARIVDQATPSPEGKPISPNVPLNLGLGVVGGVGLGLAFAFFVAFIDDRVKSSFDIEGVVGLPLIGVIPQIKRMDPVDKAQIVVNNGDRQVAEAFLTLHSSLRLKDESKTAKCVLVTSTIPGEGKSFTTTNLALTFAAHGEKVVIVDGDLRKPNIHKSFKIENLKGVIDVCGGKATLDDVIIRAVHPNLDVLPAGGRAKNPTQILNSKSFEIMLSDLRKRYDRVFIDTPPLAAVSDALIILPLVDGSIFTIYFNKVRRKAAQFSAKKLLEANVPNFGAVLNGLNLAVSGYYYAQYYDKSYKDYYVVMAKNDEIGEEK
jgi:polysaccharide biosynthesis transport protein